jgi:plastin-1
MLNEEDDPESSMDERVFKMWINSLNIEDGYINNLIEDMKDGINLNRLLEKMKPGTINWKNVKIPAKSRIIKV